MPAGVASCSRSPIIQKEVECPTNPEMMNGYLTLLLSNKHQEPVHVKVYRTSLEHFAVVCPQKKVCRPLGVLNLRNSVVERLPADSQQHGLLVRHRGLDTPLTVTFLTENAREVEEWVAAFTSSSSPTRHQSPLPIVEEEEV